MRSSSKGRSVMGWIAVTLSTLLSSFWAFWGSIENFHEGWYFRELWRNLALMAIQYLPWMFIPMVAGLVALWRPPLGVAAHVALAAAVFSLFEIREIGGLMIGIPVLLLAALYGYGRPVPLRWARRTLIGVPLLTAVASGAYPGWRVLTRPRVVDLSMRRIDGNGVNLVWAPAGPGWDETGFPWLEAKRRCEDPDSGRPRVGSGPAAGLAAADRGRNGSDAELAGNERRRDLGRQGPARVLSRHAGQGTAALEPLQPSHLLVDGR